MLDEGSRQLDAERHKTSLPSAHHRRLVDLSWPGPQAGSAQLLEVPVAGSALVMEQQRERLLKKLGRAQTRAALRRVCVTLSEIPANCSEAHQD